MVFSFASRVFLGFSCVSLVSYGLFQVFPRISLVFLAFLRFPCFSFVFTEDTIGVGGGLQPAARPHKDIIRYVQGPYKDFIRTL